MKFIDGNWLTREGFEIFTPVEAYDVHVEGTEITIDAPSSPVYNRACTLGGPLFTVKLSSPMENVVRVQITHFEGVQRRGPAFETASRPCPEAFVTDSPGEVSLTSGELRVGVSRPTHPGAGGWSVAFTRPAPPCGGDGEAAGLRETITSSGPRDMGYITQKDASGTHTYVREQLSLDVGECIYGLGERFTPFVKNGQVVDIWNRDGGTGTEQAYKNIPFYVSSKGYGVLVNHPEEVSFEVGSERVSRVQFSLPGECLDYFVINGPTVKEVLQRYAELTGKPSLPPAWSFGLWLTTSFVTSYDEETVNSFVSGMAERGLPLHVFHFDCFWMREFNWCDFRWDSRVFPDPAGMLERLKARGLRVCVWVNPYIAQRSELFREGADSGYLLRRPNGDIWQWDLWQPGMAIVDFTNPAACAWYAGKIKALVEMGVDAIKTDFGERIPTDVVYHDGSDPAKMHNYYSLLYNKVVYGALEEARGPGEAVVFARSATVGSQKFPVHWGGDCSANYPSMAESLRGGLSLCLSGFGFWSHDISGFEATATPDLYKRWAAFGMLSTHSRLHGNHTYRVPWLFDDEAVDVLRHFTKLKWRLMPYLFAAACEAAATGTPVMRAMVVEFQNDPACLSLDRQYMLGDSLLVAPVFNDQGRASYYLPGGRWTNLLTGSVIVGGSWRAEQHDYFSLPLMVRENSLLAMGECDSRPDYDYADGLSLHLFELQDGASAAAAVRGASGELELTVTVTRVADRLHVDASGIGKPWRLVLRNLELAATCLSTRGGVAVGCEQTVLGPVLSVPQGVAAVVLELALSSSVS